ncbi:MAG: AraC family transcriptional regulator [Oscillospiraceae bacterium]|nr:AraC family transcriptional regulator [Oscillospiraceae bacterium]
MNYIEVMEKCEKYIGEHLEYPPTAMELAEYSGYSLYHFCHLFRAHFGVPVAEYISHKKLEKAAENIASGMSITESAIRAGYDTPSGFAKAFRKEYGTNASEYRKNFMKEKKINPVFTEKESFSAVGYCIIPREEIRSEEYGAYWKKIDFTKYPAYPEDLEDCGEVAAWIHPDEKNGGLSYFFGFKTNCEKIPEGFTVINVPKAEYAVFEADCSVFDEKLSEKLNKLWKYIFDEWFALSEKKFDEEKMCFEFYKGEKAYICVPVK